MKLLHPRISSNGLFNYEWVASVQRLLKGELLRIIKFEIRLNHACRKWSWNNFGNNILLEFSSHFKQKNEQRRFERTYREKNMSLGFDAGIWLDESLLFAPTCYAGKLSLLNRMAISIRYVASWRHFYLIKHLFR